MYFHHKAIKSPVLALLHLVVIKQKFSLLHSLRSSEVCTITESLRLMCLALFGHVCEVQKKSMNWL